MDFIKNKYVYIEDAFPKEVSLFLYNYLVIKKLSFETLLATGYFNKNQKICGVMGDPMCPNTYSIYGDVAFDTLLMMVQQKLEEHTGLRLVPNYSYARLYEKGADLYKHKDRENCEISTTINLGGDEWPIYLKGKKKVKITPKPGGMLIYKGIELEHWREPFTGEKCGQVFLHYKDVNTKDAIDTIYDTRRHIGLPTEFKKP
jgi:hypothetical protein